MAASAVTFPAAIARVLCATDFSACANQALAQAVALAGMSKAKLFLLHVLSTVQDPVSTDFAPPCIDFDREEAEKQFRRIANSGMLDATEHSVLLARGNVPTSVLDAVRAHHIDLVILGTHGRSGLSKLAMGSVAEEVCRLATCAVLTIGPHVTATSAFENILYATDFLPGSLAAAPYAVALIRKPRGRITVLHVVDDSDIDAPNLVDLRFQSAYKRLAEMLPFTADTQVSPNVCARLGVAASTIVKVAEEEQSDLIVMGARTTRAVALAAHLAHAVAPYVIAHAHCPVLTVRG